MRRNCFQNYYRAENVEWVIPPGGLCLYHEENPGAAGLAFGVAGLGPAVAGLSSAVAGLRFEVDEKANGKKGIGGMTGKSWGFTKDTNTG